MYIQIMDEDPRAASCFVNQVFDFDENDSMIIDEINTSERKEILIAPNTDLDSNDYIYIKAVEDSFDFIYRIPRINKTTICRINQMKNNSENIAYYLHLEKMEEKDLYRFI
ncbi:uncharacterized protein LOC111634171 [Centruroides sculpturatus]|uniref:uncharacterized protein LOC111634171 n=1 Tax=Centruroides sculpturatus TaxID=218467 RepID=UPI000C6DBA11|nr:uncharacterized protein LOC111634171 [Centruroides sculpturatus]